MNPKKDLKTGAAIAGGVALMLFAGCGSDDGDDVGSTDQGIECQGGNSCAGESACAGGTGGSACEGMNECAGQGWVWAEDQDECDELREAVADS